MAGSIHGAWIEEKGDNETDSSILLSVSYLWLRCDQSPGASDAMPSLSRHDELYITLVWDKASISFLELFLIGYLFTAVRDATILKEIFLAAPSGCLDCPWSL